MSDNRGYMNKRTAEQNGAVSIFIVVFTALLITVITVSFVRIMMQDQQQATAVDLSRSAYDSAQAGVEDAKLALLRYQDACNTDGSSSINCSKLAGFINSDICNVAITGDTANTSEIQVKTGSSADLNQAYTCVKVKLDTNDYLGIVNPGQSRIIPLVSKVSFDQVKIEWYSSENLQLSGNAGVAFNTYKALQPGTLSNPNATNVPTILRAQVVQLGSTFTLSDFDNNAGNTGSSTFFLYPQSAASSTVAATTDTRMSPTAIKPTPAACVSSASVAYSCSKIINLQRAVVNGDHAVYLRLSSVYGAANDYRVTLINSAVPTQAVPFNAVQPEIDSTGRANDLFKRVRTRVDLSDINFPYPSAAVETNGDFCKNFSITDNPSDYNQGSVGLIGGCNP